MDSGDKKAPAPRKPGVMEPSEPTKEEEEEQPEEPSELAKENQSPEKQSDSTADEQQQQPETPRKEKRQQPEVFVADKDEGTFKTPTYH